MPLPTKTRLRRLIKPGLLMLISLATTATSAAAWERIGSDPLSPDTEIFLKREALEELETDNFYVMALNVHPTTVRGIDLPTSNGGMKYDTRYPHRSFVEISIYDCARGMSAIGQTLYFSGTRPKEDELVYKHLEEESLLFPVLPRDPVFDAVCK